MGSLLKPIAAKPTDGLSGELPCPGERVIRPVDRNGAVHVALNQVGSGGPRNRATVGALVVGVVHRIARDLPTGKWTVAVPGGRALGSRALRRRTRNGPGEILTRLSDLHRTGGLARRLDTCVTDRCGKRPIAADILRARARGAIPTSASRNHEETSASEYR